MSILLTCLTIQALLVVVLIETTQAGKAVLATVAALPRKPGNDPNHQAIGIAMMLILLFVPVLVLCAFRVLVLGKR